MAGKKPCVVIVGGGIAGGTVAKALQSHSDVVLIDPKEYFEITWAEMRAKVEPTFADRTIINHKEYLTNVNLMTTTAVDIKSKEVMTKDGRLVPYDYLIIATGHHDPYPVTKGDRLREFQADNKKIKDSSCILIVGGGPSGVELAGEIAVDYPDKKVTLVHKGPRLMEFVGPKASAKAMKWFKENGVDVLLDQKVDLEHSSDGVYSTTAGKTINADCIFICTGKPFGSSWLRESILKDCVNQQGQLMVDEHLKVKGHSNIFAIGDITDVNEMKQGYIAQEHAALVAKNLQILVKGGQESKLGSYKPAGAMAIVTLGRKNAVAQFPFATVSGCIPRMIKSKDLFVGMTRKKMGLKG
ncbi:putative Apoptosis-inducing factor [Zostera marina]|uniref:Putative Apoptosis-inducing factor n=1 Tax=Zostera marina TaxID=29655 RepID=A0A0K9NK40_ZOSMR|nr:putative Apoptosis-inducing factor [Zostera marina]